MFSLGPKSNLKKREGIRDFKIRERGRLEERDRRREPGSRTQRSWRESEQHDEFFEFETRELLCISHAIGFITDAEFLLLYEESRSDNLDWSRVYRQFKGKEASHNNVKIFDVFT